MLMVSVNGAAPTPADNVVIYDDTTPVAIAVAQADVVMWADAARDPEFPGMARALDLTPTDVTRFDVTLDKGKL